MLALHNAGWEGSAAGGSRIWGGMASELLVSCRLLYLLVRATEAVNLGDLPQE